MLNQLQDPVREEFDREGYVILRNVIDAELIAEASAHVDWLEQRHGLRGEDLGTELVADDPFWLRLVGNDRLLDIAERFVGPDIALFASHYISKPPYSGKAVLWHQDAAYWPLEPMNVISLWLAIDRSTPENGCMRVVPGSHRDVVHGLRERTDIDNVLGSEAVVEVDESSAVDLVLAPGDVEAHHPGIMHASSANTSPMRRCGLTIRYIPTTTRIVCDGTWQSAFLLRGRPGVNRYRTPPTFDPARHFPHRDVG